MPNTPKESVKAKFMTMSYKDGGIIIRNVKGLNFGGKKDKLETG